MSYFSMLILLLPLLGQGFQGRVPNLPLLALGSVYADQGSLIPFFGSGIRFSGSLLFSG